MLAKCMFLWHTDWESAQQVPIMTKFPNANDIDTILKHYNLLMDTKYMKLTL